MSNRTTLTEPPGMVRLDDEMVELPLLLTSPQAEVLEAAAHCRGVTVAQMLRHLIRDFLIGRNSIDQPAPHDQQAVASVGR